MGINQIAMAQEPAVWLVLLAALMVAAAANSEDGVGIGEDSDLHLSRSRELYDGDLGENPGKVAKQSTSALFADDYFRIPHFAYTYLAQQVKDKSAEDCATLCSNNPECLLSVGVMTKRACGPQTKSDTIRHTIFSRRLTQAAKHLTTTLSLSALYFKSPDLKS